MPLNYSNKNRPIKTKPLLPLKVEHPLTPTKKPFICAILFADVHLSEKPPVARSVEPSWYDVMKRQLQEIFYLSTFYNVPVFCAGDVFDRWSAPASLINLAIAHLPHIYAIPGQHDLVHHSLEDIRRTPFWTLVEAKKITYVESDKPVEVPGAQPIRLHGFPFGVEIVPLNNPHDMFLEVALIHTYMWTQNTGYVNAPKDKRIGQLKDKLVGYDLAVVGDNHKPFYSKLKMEDDKVCHVWNCGGFLRRKIDEIEHEPSVGLLYSDGTIERHYLDVSKDLFISRKDLPIIKGIEVDAEEFLTELGNLADVGINFIQTVERFLEDQGVAEAVSSIIRTAMGKDLK